VLLAIIFISAGLIFGYWYRGKQLADRAWQYYYEGRAVEALAMYEVINRQYPITWGPFEDVTAHARYLEPELRDYLHASGLNTKGQRKEAILAYEMFLDEHFPYGWGSNLYLSLAREALVTLSLDEVEYLQKQGEYKNALEMYKTLLDFQVHGGCDPGGDYDIWGNACQHADEVTEQVKSKVREKLPQVFIEWQVDPKWQQDIQDFILQYQAIINSQPGLIPSGTVENTLKTAYRVWAEKITTHNDFDAGVEGYREAMESYPTNVPREPIEEILAEMYGIWAVHLRENGNYEKAVNNYELILEEFPGTSSGLEAQEKLAQTFAEWAYTLRQEGKYKEAIEKYQHILTEFPDTSIVDEVKRLIAEAQTEYDVWKEITRANPVANFPPEVKRDDEGKWSWRITFEETGGKIGYTLSGEGWIIDQNGGKWGPWGMAINRGTVEVPPGGKVEDSYSSRGDEFVGGHAEFLWVGEDENGHYIEIVEQVYLLP